MANTLADLDAALTALGTALSQLDAEIPLLVTKIQANPTVDYTAETQALQSMLAGAQQAIAQAKVVTGQ